ncbi:ribonuclease P protein component [Corynebacterium yudongzhengii]|uniref:Ribonuclease P protein component n=1 Tax=Corynebacterium yudongzhengii TaxID=2080740 RepID=A0A2U1T4I9_9CORY|nr:ribonuclease P protein component [Corynebacterium yudongzhengii]AWB82886.1 ribonuclease P protein component [Corynebacterium yudongzhengii]PWC00919.1 ribonuclease P protein component [Corynebacterium yudongzhengii]
MLPKKYKFTSPAEFSRTVKKGTRAGSKTVVVHFHDLKAGPGAAFVTTGGPRFGLIVSKAVGGAVVRHRTSRRLRHICAALIDDLPPTAGIVVRALPAAGGADSDQLRRDIVKCLTKARSKWPS